MIHDSVLDILANQTVDEQLDTLHRMMNAVEPDSELEQTIVDKIQELENTLPERQFLEMAELFAEDPSSANYSKLQALVINLQAARYNQQR